MRQLFVWMICALLMGCTFYSWNNVRYPSRDQAISVVHRDYQTKLQSVSVVERKVPGKIAIVLPQRLRVEARGIVTTGRATGDQIGYVADTLMIGHRSMAEAVERSRVFDSVTIVESMSPPDSSVEPTDWTLWLDLPGPYTAKWYLRRNGDGKTVEVPVDTDSHLARRVSEWAVAVQKTALALSSSAGSPRQGQPYQGPSVSSGTCFAVRPDGYLVTSEHVVSGASMVHAAFQGKEARVATILVSDPVNDVAILKVSEPTPDFLPLGSGNEASLGDHLFTIGFPVSDLLGTQPKYSEGALTSKAGLRGAPTYIQVSVPIQPGNSGGPLIDDQGRVIAIVAAQASVRAFYAATGTIPQSINWGVKSEYVAPLLPRVQLQPQVVHRSRREIVSAAERAVCQVLATQ